MSHWVIMVGLCGVLVMLLRHRPPATTAPAVPADVPPPPVPLTLSCPNCGYSMPLEDLGLVGETVSCPICEEIFEVLEPLPGDRSVWEQATRPPVCVGPEDAIQ